MFKTILMSLKKIATALISVYHKDGLEPIIRLLHNLGVHILSTGGTKEFIDQLGIPVTSVEELTSFPAILDGRVKTLHPKVFGGILARREPAHLEQLDSHDIPAIDLVIVDLYPFEKTVAATTDEKAIIEKIDIGGISLIRAGAKNFKDVLVVPSRHEYLAFLALLENKQGYSDLLDRQWFATRAFGQSAHYDTAIYQYFSGQGLPAFGLLASGRPELGLRYGENPHQKAAFYGALDQVVEQLGGKELSYNNLVDIDAALHLISEFNEHEAVFAVLKHTNPCGVAIRATVKEAWEAALACDPVSAFGGIIVTNQKIDLETAKGIDTIFYEVLIAPDFDPAAQELLTAKKKRILLKLVAQPRSHYQVKSILNGLICQEHDRHDDPSESWTRVTVTTPNADETAELAFALKCVKHLKSNAIAITKQGQLIGGGCGQTSRVDAMKQAIDKAREHGFDTAGAFMASDAFFPFADTVEIAHQAGINHIIQPGGSIRDQDSVDYCNAHGMCMVITGVRHFKH